MRGPRITVSAAMRATSIRIETVTEGNVRAVVAGNNCLRIVFVKLCPRSLKLAQEICVVLELFDIGFDMHALETIRRTDLCAATNDGKFMNIDCSWTR